MNGIGLVLAGGGGKGAYQIGVWKYLREVGLDRNVCAVSGTSVGALNAALFAAGNFENAEKIWKNMKPELILSPKTFSTEDIYRWLADAEIMPFAGSGDDAQGLPPASALAPALSRRVRQSLPFSREGLLQLMREGVDFAAIQNAPIPCYVTCLTVPGLKVRRFDLRAYAAEEARKLLLATSAIPLVFDSVEFEGQNYCDGGVPFVGDNTPIAPIFQEEVRYIIVVHLTRDVLINHAKYPGAKLIEITPRTDLGGLSTGTLDFTAQGALWRMEQGYEDTKKALGGFVEAAMIHRQNELIFQAFEASERRYLDRLTMMKAQNRVFLSRWNRDSYDEILEEFSESGEAEEDPAGEGTWQEDLAAVQEDPAAAEDEG